MSKKTMEYAKKLVSQMTIDEKISQMLYESPAIERLGIPEYNWWNEALHGVARAGTATVFPQAIALAAMFDDKKLKEIADVIAEEGRAKYHAFSREGDMLYQQRDVESSMNFQKRVITEYTRDLPSGHLM